MTGVNPGNAEPDLFRPNYDSKRTIDAMHRFQSLMRSSAQPPDSGRIGESEEATMLKGGLLWLLGIPLPIILLLWFFGVFH